MSKDRTLKKKEVVEFTARLLNTFRNLFSDYQKAVGFGQPPAQVGDWAIEQSYLGQTGIESILKITKIEPKHGEYWGIDLLGEERHWGNSNFIKLPESATKYLEGEYRW